MKRSTWLLCVVLLSACDCDEDRDPPAAVPDMVEPTEMGQPDMPEELKPDGDMDTPVCQPQTQCAANTCGMVDDGCGGQLDCGGPRTCEDLGQVCGTQDDGCGAELDCGVCLCENGTPKEPTCGTCGLGRVSCESAAGSCVGPNFEACTQVLYVKKGAVLTQGDGSLSQPFDTIYDALEAATTPGTTIVIMGSDTYRETVRVKEGIHILGGYDEQGLYDSSQWPIITGTEPFNQGVPVIAVRAVNIKTRTRLSHLRIESVDAQLPGQDSIGVWADEANALELHELKVRAGRAQSGLDGQPGQPGADAPNLLGQNPREGVNGASGGHKNRFNDTSATLFGTPSAVLNNGGINPSCPQANGGRGGEGAQARLSFDTLTIVPAESGQWGRQPTTMISPMDDQGQPGIATYRSGRGGFNGPTGQDARPLNAISADQVELKAQGRFIIEGGQGQAGAPGEHGYGGQGGGGAFVWESIVENRLYWLEGPQGAGGSAGGCGGQGGQGGQPGGSSVAVALLDSTGIVLDQVQLETRLGGLGGLGGDGGDGGQPQAAHALGARGVCDNGLSGCFTPQNTYYTSGNGGFGGAGGKGARGQDGSHGFSLGVFCQETTLTALPDAITGPQVAPAGFALPTKGCL